MRIVVDTHTQERASEWGATIEEIEEVLRSGETIPVKKERHGNAKVFEFKSRWQGRFYEQKKVEVIPSKAK